MGTNRQLLKPAGDQRLSHTSMECRQIVARQGLKSAQSQTLGQFPSFGQLISSSNFPLAIGEEDPVRDSRYRRCIRRDGSPEEGSRMIGLQVISKLLGALQ